MVGLWICAICGAQKIFKGIIGFLAFAVIAAYVELLIMYGLSDLLDARLYPRGLAWIVVPIFAGIFGYRFLSAYPISNHFNHVFQASTKLNRLLRVYIATIISWFIGVGAYVIVVKPFGYSISDSEWLFLLQVLFVPPVVVWIIGMLYGWALRK